MRILRKLWLWWQPAEPHEGASSAERNEDLDRIRLTWFAVRLTAVASILGAFWLGVHHLRTAILLIATQIAGAVAAALLVKLGKSRSASVLLALAVWAFSIALFLRYGDNSLLSLGLLAWWPLGAALLGFRESLIPAGLGFLLWFWPAFSSELPWPPEPLAPEARRIVWTLLIAHAGFFLGGFFRRQHLEKLRLRRREKEHRVARERMAGSLKRGNIALFEELEDGTLWWTDGAARTLHLGTAALPDRIPALLNMLPPSAVVQSKNFAAEYVEVAEVGGSSLAGKVEWRILRNPTGRLEGSAVDISSMETMREMLHHNLERFRLFAESPLIAMFIHRSGKLLEWNRPFETLTRYNAEELAALPSLMDLVAPEYREMAAKQLDLRELTPPMEIDGLRKGSERIRLQIQGAPIRYKGEAARLAILRDVQDEYLARRELELRANRDLLTGLYNRERFLAKAHEALAKSKAAHAALLLLDLDGFKELNDTLGHLAGDEALTVLAGRFIDMSHLLLIGRMGGDEFGFFMEGESPAEFEAVAERLSESIRRHLQAGGAQVSLGGSFGVAISPEHGTTIGELLRSADIAMYHGKREGGSVTVFRPEWKANNPRRLKLLSDLEGAIRHGQIRLAYQPIVQLKSRRVDLYECLARWSHPEFGEVPPIEFIPLIEVGNLALPFTLHVLREAMQASVRHKKRLAVNLSPKVLSDDSFPVRVAALLQETGAETEKIELEITESSFISDPTRAIGVLHALREMGFRLSIDDFGTGYSSLSYLARLPVQAVKIDRSFVVGMKTSQADRVVIEALVGISAMLELDLIAEGIETEEVAETLRSLGCSHGQGWVFGKPSFDFLPEDSPPPESPSAH